MLALTTNVLRKWEGAVIDHDQTSVVRLETREAIIDKIGYVLANPVEAGLVRYARDWPGAKSHPNDLGGGTMTAARPGVYLDPARWPETAVLALALPVGVEDHEADAWRAAVKESIAEHEARGRAEVERKRQKFLGAERAERVSPYDRATGYEPIRDRNPTFAVSGVFGAQGRGACAAGVEALQAAADARMERCFGAARAVNAQQGARARQTAAIHARLRRSGRVGRGQNVVETNLNAGRVARRISTRVGSLNVGRVAQRGSGRLGRVAAWVGSLNMGRVAHIEEKL